MRTFEVGKTYIHKRISYGTKECVFAGEHMAVLRSIEGEPLETGVWNSDRDNWKECHVPVVQKRYLTVNPDAAFARQYSTSTVQSSVLALTNLELVFTDGKLTEANILRELK